MLFRSQSSSAPQASGSSDSSQLTKKQRKALRAAQQTTATPAVTATPRPARPAASGSAAASGSQVFAQGAEYNAAWPCVICLGRHTHNCNHCRSLLLWNGKDKTHDFRSDAGRIVATDASGQVRDICMDFQLSRRCSNTSGKHFHACFSCGRANYGACDCPKAQGELPNDSISS